MKKVRFESQVKTFKINSMNDSECHSPRPFIEKQVKTIPVLNYTDCLPKRKVPYINDPVQRFEYGNSSPYPVINRTHLSDSSKILNKGSPSNELDLSMLDCTYSEPRSALPRQNFIHSNPKNIVHSQFQINPSLGNNSARILTAIENQTSNLPNILNKPDNFFLRRDNLSDLKQVHSQLNDLHLDKENNPLLRKSEMMKLGINNPQKKHTESKHLCNPRVEINQICRCHHCLYVYNTKQGREVKDLNMARNNYNAFTCVEQQPNTYMHCPCNYSPINNFIPQCDCSKSSHSDSKTSSPQNAVDKKNWTIEKYEQTNGLDCLEIEKQKNLSTEKREPTVADLFKIIKLQNEQLQQLQEKVDKFILSQNSASETQRIQPIKNYVTEHVEVKSIGTDEKISIGVMTSFEMFRTSTIINKEIVKQSEAQIQCNRSQISIKEVVSKSPSNLNFLNGIAPVTNQTEAQINNTSPVEVDNLTNIDNVDKTLNEMSLYNVQVNTDTPQMSPEQSLYLDVRDYSDSDASTDEQSNVGWTYYNKIMTHVNGMLQESDMPSSASAMYRNGRQKCLQMQIDKTNVSVAKRVTFGDDPLALREQPHLQAPATDTSLKMNQLAAKYLKNAPMSKTPSPKPLVMPVDMSLATRNYMEKHKLLYGNQNVHQHMELPKFLDITALKQQPKFL